jgi:hypothetical protein
MLSVGVQDLKLRQADELVTQGHSLTTKFKTAATYGYQPVTVSEVRWNGGCCFFLLLFINAH